MKVVIYADPHWSCYSSILRKRGKEYSRRLENLIESIQWVEDLAVETCSKKVICLGDFFDNSNLNAEELTALKEINFNDNIEHEFIVGNHEITTNTTNQSTAHLFKLIKNFTVIDKPTVYQFSEDKAFYYLPYQTELDTSDKALDNYFDFSTSNIKHRFLFTHNNLKNFQLGHFISKTGLDTDEISNKFDVCFNGHLHNGGRIKNIINVGNVTGQNFSEDGFKYKHRALVLDTKTGEISDYTNPYAISFYKLDLTGENITKDNLPGVLETNVKRGVMAVKCLSKDIDIVKSILSNSSNVEEYKIMIAPDRDLTHNKVTEIEEIDHLKEFRNYVIENIGNDADIIEELNLVTQ